MNPPATETFEHERQRLKGLAYRMTGSVRDAEDIVQEAWLRWNGADRSTIDNPPAWLTTATTRLAVDRLRSAQHRRETYVGPWLPEPAPSVDIDGDPAAAVVDAESLTLAFLCVLDRLEPRERAVFLLHDVFDRPFTEVADAVGVSVDNARQIAGRARQRVRDEHRQASRAGDGAGLLQAFLDAVVLGDEETLIGLLTTDATWVSDGGADVRAARRPVVGADKVARFILNLAERAGPDIAVRVAELNGRPSVLVGWTGQGVDLALSLDTDDDRIHTIRAVLNPDKLAHLSIDPA